MRGFSEGELRASNEQLPPRSNCNAALRAVVLSRRG
jgi:hypothetical protein